MAINIKELKKIPHSPGIYIFKDAKNKPLYIGKSSDLKNRVKYYLKTTDFRLQKMIGVAKKLDYIRTTSDIEALILESQYIKKYKPMFNIMLRDDKQYFYVGFSDEQFSKIFLTHQPQNVASSKRQVIRDRKNRTTNYLLHTTDYVGPFTDGSALKTTLNYLRRIFPYCTCKQPHNNYCLNYHIGKCPGFCCLKNPGLKTKAESLKQYRKNIKTIKDILSGKRVPLIKKLEKEMVALGKKEKFEEAIELRGKLEKLERVFENAKIIIRLNESYPNCPDIKHYDTSKYHSKTLSELKDVLRLKNLPHRIEAYDIANIQGKYAVGAMVVFDNGKPDKNEYRKFKIRTKESPDDIAMLKEVLTRRFNHPEWPAPDLILVDGGKAQLNAARSAINYRLSMIDNIPIIALTKNKKHQGTKIFVSGRKNTIPLSPLPVSVKNLMLNIDSEAHRFAISYYRKLHRKKALRPL